jgi:uncharacterized coiled-coil protein SlyX
MNPSESENARLVGLEERLTFQQRQIDELQAVVLEHRRQLDSLARAWSQCREGLESLRQSGAGENVPHEKPPHY